MALAVAPALIEGAFKLAAVWFSARLAGLEIEIVEDDGVELDDEDDDGSLH
jgi:hypothetical protein